MLIALLFTLQPSGIFSRFRRSKAWKQHAQLLLSLSVGQLFSTQLLAWMFSIWSGMVHLEYINYLENSSFLISFTLKTSLFRQLNCTWHYRCKVCWRWLHWSNQPVLSGTQKCNTISTWYSVDIVANCTLEMSQ